MEENYICEQFLYAISMVWSARELMRKGNRFKTTIAYCTSLIDLAFEKYPALELDEEIIAEIQNALENSKNPNEDLKVSFGICRMFLGLPLE